MQETHKAALYRLPERRGEIMTMRNPATGTERLGAQAGAAVFSLASPSKPCYATKEKS